MEVSHTSTRNAPADKQCPSIAAISPPPLENGDRLTRAEFERRYEAMPEKRRRN